LLNALRSHHRLSPSASTELNQPIASAATAAFFNRIGAKLSSLRVAKKGPFMN
jgi:hypothetical protein